MASHQFPTAIFFFLLFLFFVFAEVHNNVLIVDDPTSLPKEYYLKTNENQRKKIVFSGNSTRLASPGERAGDHQTEEVSSRQSPETLIS